MNEEGKELVINFRDARLKQMQVEVEYDELRKQLVEYMIRNNLEIINIDDIVIEMQTYKYEKKLIQREAFEKKVLKIVTGGELFDNFRKDKIKNNK